ncbi:GlcG/HbpS family heme-binding protein [Sulfuriflexus mobilis]|uniref:GlcG/HbpS family heme-binding protein n=1 Tax=Sulfuriflexus mobilis TaxID=1811807 RepID=UPI000F81F5C8|nr:heme-binding protein [Sulfuriflexus mobilis]
MHISKLSLLPMLAAVVATPLLAEEPMTISVKRLTLDTASRIAQAAIKQCRKEGVQIAVTVVDRAGHPQVVMRDVLAMDITLTISKQKAHTAMAFNTPLSEMEDRFKGAYAVPKIDGLVVSAGGLPINIAGTILGGVGVSGAPSGVTDEKCAKAGVDAVRADLELEG